MDYQDHPDHIPISIFVYQFQLSVLVYFINAVQRNFQRGSPSEGVFSVPYLSPHNAPATKPATIRIKGMNTRSHIFMQITISISDRITGNQRAVRPDPSSERGELHFVQYMVFRRMNFTTSQRLSLFWHLGHIKLIPVSFPTDDFLLFSCHLASQEQRSDLSAEVSASCESPQVQQHRPLPQARVELKILRSRHPAQYRPQADAPC